MTIFSGLLPPIRAKDLSAPAPKKRTPKGHGYDLHAVKRSSKYDHRQMLLDRIEGMSWADIAEKHGVPPAAKHPAATSARVVCLASRAVHHLTPEQVARLNLSERSS